MAGPGPPPGPMKIGWRWAGLRARRFLVLEARFKSYFQRNVRYPMLSACQQPIWGLQLGLRLILLHAGLDELLDQRSRQRLVQRKSEGSLPGHVFRELRVFVHITTGIHADMVRESREVDETAPMPVRRHLVADSLFGLWRRFLDQLTKPAQVRLRRFGRSRDVCVDFVCHLPDFSESSSSARRSIDSLAPSSIPEATMPSRSMTDSNTVCATTLLLFPNASKVPTLTPPWPRPPSP